MMQFTDVPKAMPKKRPAQDRAADFDEIYGQFEPEKCRRAGIALRAVRHPFCQVHCPLHNNIRTG
jgi:glutamate synthase (NADPH/NADH) small chain